MKKFQGTKGDWEATYFGLLSEGKTKVFTSTEGNRKYICKTYLNSYISNIKECEANAKLIASAPDLLKALQELVHLHQCEQEGLSSGQPTAKQWYETVLKAEEVINKAL